MTPTIPVSAVLAHLLEPTLDRGCTCEPGERLCPACQAIEAMEDAAQEEWIEALRMAGRTKREERS